MSSNLEDLRRRRDSLFSLLGQQLSGNGNATAELDRLKGEVSQQISRQQITTQEALKRHIWQALAASDVGPIQQLSDSPTVKRALGVS